MLSLHAISTIAIARRLSEGLAIGKQLQHMYFALHYILHPLGANMLRLGFAHDAVLMHVFI